LIFYLDTVKKWFLSAWTRRRQPHGWCTHTNPRARAHTCVVMSWALGLWKASARGGRVIDSRRQQHIQQYMLCT